MFAADQRAPPAGACLPEYCPALASAPASQCGVCVCIMMCLLPLAGCIKGSQWAVINQQAVVDCGGTVMRAAYHRVAEGPWCSNCTAVGSMQG